LTEKIDRKPRQKLHTTLNTKHTFQVIGQIEQTRSCRRQKRKLWLVIPNLIQRLFYQLGHGLLQEASHRQTEHIHFLGHRRQFVWQLQLAIDLGLPQELLHRGIVRHEEHFAHVLDRMLHLALDNRFIPVDINKYSINI